MHNFSSHPAKVKNEWSYASKSPIRLRDVERGNLSYGADSVIGHWAVELACR